MRERLPGVAERHEQLVSGAEPAPKPSLAEIAAKAVLESVPGGGPLNAIISGLQERRQYAAEHALGAISERVGWDNMLSIVERDPEIEALLWLVLEATVATGVESKRKLLQKVVENAMTSDEPIDPEQILAAALAELDAPHVRALVRLIKAEQLDERESREYEHLLSALKREPIPILATLMRVGVLYPGSVSQGRDRHDKQVVSPGVTPFGHDLIEHLRGSGWED